MHSDSPKTLRNMEEGDRPDSSEESDYGSPEKEICDNLLESGGSQQLVDILLFNETITAEFLSLKISFFK